MKQMMKDLEDLESMVKDEDDQNLGDVIQDTTSYMEEHTKSFMNLRKKIVKINNNADDVLASVDFYGS